MQRNAVDRVIAGGSGGTRSGLIRVSSSLDPRSCEGEIYGARPKGQGAVSEPSGRPTQRLTLEGMCWDPQHS